MKKSYIVLLVLFAAIFVVAAAPAPAVPAAGGVVGAEIDLAALVAAAIGGVGPIFVVIFGLVEYVRNLGVRDMALLMVSMLIGLIFGLCYLVATLGTPADFGAWFAYCVTAILYGLAASGVVKLGKRLADGV
ncbi:MAG: hypothetical protein KF821_08965 [Anaerolineales bacterium]|nr:hypothetical protein [Anaerolineales bacterium]